MNVNTSRKAPAAHEAPLLLAGAMPMKPTIMRQMKMPTKPYKKIVRLPKRLIIGQEQSVPTKAMAYSPSVMSNEAPVESPACMNR